MKPLSGLGIGLSIVFGCLFLALVAEVYYLLWWKRLRVRAGSGSGEECSGGGDDEEDRASSAAGEFLGFFCFKKPVSSAALNPTGEICPVARITDEASAPKPLGGAGYGDGSIEAELMRLHNLSGPTRLLFTIKEETKEDLESEDGRSRKGSRGKSLSELFFATAAAAAAGETPFITPSSSPPFFTPPLTPLESYCQQGFNPLFESKKDDETVAAAVAVAGGGTWIRASPPPKFKFLRDAEEKLYRRTLMEEALKVHRSNSLAFAAPLDGHAHFADNDASSKEKEAGSFLAIGIDSSKSPEKKGGANNNSQLQKPQ